MKEWHWIIDRLKQAALHRPASSNVPDPLHSETLIKTAKNHHVLPHIYREAPLPWLQKEIQRHQITCLKKFSELRRLSKQFNENNIQHIHLKGPLLAHQLYENTAMRTYGDLDFFISKENLLKAALLLEASGYVPYSSEPNQYPLELIPDKKDFVFIHPEKRLAVEIHFRLVPQVFLRNINWDMAWKTRESIVLAGETFSVLSKEHNLVYLCAHGHKHAWERLDWLLDFTVFCRRYFENGVAAAHSIAEAYGIAEEMKTALRLSSYFFGFEANKPTKEELSYKIIQVIDRFHQMKGEGTPINKVHKLQFWRRAAPKKTGALLWYLKNTWYEDWLSLEKPLRSYHVWLAVKMMKARAS